MTIGLGVRSRLARLLRPRSIAVIGGREAEEVALQCDRIGFSGDIWPVNPRRAEIAGRACFASVAELPHPPDAAFVAAPREAAVAAIGELAALGAHGAVVYASGFSEAGDEGAALGAQARRRQRRHGADRPQLLWRRSTISTASRYGPTNMAARGSSAASPSRCNPAISPSISRCRRGDFRSPMSSPSATMQKATLPTMSRRFSTMIA